MTTETAEPTTDAGEPPKLRNTGYEILMAGLSILSIVNIVLLYTVKEQALDYVLIVMNVLLTFTFFIDFLYRLRKADSKSEYFFHGFGWADLLASLPFPQVKILRVFRLIKVARLIQDYGIKGVIRSLMDDRAGSALFLVLLIGIYMLEFGSLGMLGLESNSPDANIVSASDAMWYIIVTMSTVGYGDQYPVTNPGRILGTTIIIIGVAIFGTLTGFLANAFLSPKPKKPIDEDQPREPDAVAKQLESLKELAARQQEAIAELEALVNRPG